MKAWFASLFLVAALSCPAVAQSAEPTQSQLASAQELLKLTGMEQIMRNTFERQGDLIKQQIQKTAPQASPEAVELVSRIAREEAEKAVPHLLDESAKIYARNFSEDDLRGLIAFYQTPLGKRLIAKLPDITHEVAQVTAELGSNIFMRVREELPKLNPRSAPEQKR